MDIFKETIRSTNKEFPQVPLILCDWNTGKQTLWKTQAVFPIASSPGVKKLVNQTSKEMVQLTSELSPLGDIM